MFDDLPREIISEYENIDFKAQLSSIEDLIFGTYNKIKSFNDNIVEWQNENGII